MKKFFLVAAAMFVALGASAQDGSQVKNLFVEKFVNKSNLNDITVNNLRQEIMSGIAATKRVNLKDAAAYDGDESVPTGKRERIAFLSENGYDFLLDGTLNSIDQKSKSKDDKTTYEATINYTLTLTDLSTGTVKSSNTYKDSWYSGSTADEAILKAIEQSVDRMKKYVDDNFKVEAVVKALDDINQKKNEAKTLYVTTGSNDGVEKGQIFEVFAEIEVAGEIAKKKIGEVKADEVMSGSLTHCTVKNGGAEIKKYFDQNCKLIVVTRARKDALGLGSLGLGL